MEKCIWYVSKYVAPPGKGSAGGRGYLLMREFVQLGYRSVIVTSDSNHLTNAPELSQPYFKQEVDGIELWWVRTLKYRAVKSVRRILSWIDFELRLFLMPKDELPNPDAVIVSSLSLLTILNGFMLRRRYACRLIFEIRDIWPLTLVQEGGFGKKNPFVLALAWIERLGYRHADGIVGTMPNLGEHVTNVLGEMRPTECVPMGVEETMLAEVVPLPNEYVERHLPKDKFIIVHAGSIGITNALDTFFDCAERSVKYSKLHFLVVGDGDLRGYYQEKYGHLPNLSFAPKVPKQMVQSVLEKCDLLYFAVHVSEVWRYGQSLNKVIDYMLAAKPVVASYSGYPSMINEAGCGTYVAAGDVSALMEEVLRYASLPVEERLLIGLRGREWILANRNYRTLAEHYLNFLFPSSYQTVKNAN